MIWGLRGEKAGGLVACDLLDLAETDAIDAADTFANYICEAKFESQACVMQLFLKTIKKISEQEVVDRNTNLVELANAITQIAEDYPLELEVG